MKEIFENARKASTAILALSARERSQLLLDLSASLLERRSELLAANAEDLLAMDKSNPLYDRLMLTEDRVASIASDMANVARLEDPTGRELERRTLPNGLELRKVSVPYGVIGVIFEARPNVIFDVFSLCFKSGNVCVLKGGKDAEHSNRKAVEILRQLRGE